MTNWETVVGFITLFGFLLNIMRLNESINTLNATNHEFRLDIESAIKDRRALNVAIEKVAESVKSAHKRIDRLEQR